MLIFYNILIFFQHILKPHFVIFSDISVGRHFLLTLFQFDIECNGYGKLLKIYYYSKQKKVYALKLQNLKSNKFEKSLCLTIIKIRVLQC